MQRRMFTGGLFWYHKRQNPPTHMPNVSLEEAAKRDIRYKAAKDFIWRLFDNEKKPEMRINVGDYVAAHYDTKKDEICMQGWSRPSWIIHECVHAMDEDPRSNAKKAYAPETDQRLNYGNKIVAAYMEGRATFAEHLYRSEYGHIPEAPGRGFFIRERIRHPFNKILIGATGVITYAGAGLLLLKTGLMHGLTEMISTDALLVFGYGIYVSKNVIGMSDSLKKYFPFYNSLCQLAKHVGDPVKAFRISTEKPPTSWEELLFPKKFYAEEIAKAKAEAEGQ